MTDPVQPVPPAPMPAPANAEPVGPAAPFGPPASAGPAGAVQLRAAVAVLVALTLLGVVLGLVWSWWSPARPIGFVVAAHAVQPDETEAFVAGDGRFAALTALAGVSAAVLVWFVRSLRGPLAAGALAGGGLLGAWLTERVGHAVGGGSSTGPAQSLIAHLPLNVHMSGLLAIEAGLAVLTYGLLVAFAASDDLDAARPSGSSPEPAYSGYPAASVGFGAQPQDRWGHGDAAGALHEPDLSP